MPTTTIGTFHSAATSTGNGSSLAVPSGDIVVNVALTGSGPIGAVIRPQVSADNSTWVDLQPSTRITGAGSVSSMVDVATTAAYIRVVLSEISGTNAAATVTLASYYQIIQGGLTRSPDGSLVADATQISDYPMLFPLPKDVKTPLELISGAAYPTICVGSSTTEQYTTANLPTDKPQEATDGVFGCVQQAYGSPFHVIRAGFRGVGGTLTGPVGTANTVLDKLQSGLALAGTPKFVIFQPRGNDDISTAEGLAQLLRYVEQGIQLSIAAGAKVFLIQQHLKIANIPEIAQYEACNDAYTLLAKRFFGQVFVVDHYSRIMGADGLPNAALLDATGVHLNAAGAIACVPAWERPLREAGIYPNCFRPIDPLCLPAANSILNTNPLFEDETTGTFSSTGWAGVASYSTIAQGPDDIFGRKSIRLTQIAGQTAGYLRQTYTPSGAACIARATCLFTPRQNVGELGITVRNSSSSWSASLMAAKRGADRVALENGRTYIYVSAPFAVDTAFFAANSQLNAIVAPTTVDPSTISIVDVSGLALIKIADTWA